MLETERLVLRKPRLDDADDLVELVGDPEVMRWLSGTAGDRTLAVESVERWLRHWAENGIGQFVVVFEGRLIGRAGFLVWDSATFQVSSFAAAGENAMTELGWAIVRAQWGHGFASEAARALRDWAYARDTESLVSLIHPDNTRSQRVAVKLGAVPAETVEASGRPAVVWRHAPVTKL